MFVLLDEDEKLELDNAVEPQKQGFGDSINAKGANLRATWPPVL